MPDVRNNTTLNRFELDVDGHLALAYYRPTPGVITFTHTEVPPALSGRGIGSALARGALEKARAQGLKVVAKCEFIGGYIAKHPELATCAVATPCERVERTPSSSLRLGQFIVPFPLINQDISWSSYNEKWVLLEATRTYVPLQELLRFLSIFSSNLDEYYRVRMPVLHALHKLKISKKKSEKRLCIKKTCTERLTR